MNKTIKNLTSEELSEAISNGVEDGIVSAVLVIVIISAFLGWVFVRFIN